ncbi:39S ribosomal protein L51, mitochondrial [Linderina macrospora]|uniref:39S ribosomal protein L51, mitochondrial n=1 Tax=Linderina macrospora TaxID=4868 RepID=A0ACC1JHH8_9FUNG|nr:39S ribosomal protein L51, mitochondrial [Linderina macrospora]
MATFRYPRVLNELVRAEKDALIKATKPKNGVGAFVFPCRKMVFNYCERSGSSNSFKDYLQGAAVKFAKENPQIEVVVQPRPSRHPIIRAFYTNGAQKAKCLRKVKSDDIPEVVKSLRDHAGYKLRRWNKYVISDTPSVRGIFSPFHVKEVHHISDMKSKN